MFAIENRKRRSRRELWTLSDSSDSLIFLHEQKNLLVRPFLSKHQFKQKSIGMLFLNLVRVNGRKSCAVLWNGSESTII